MDVVAAEVPEVVRLIEMESALVAIPLPAPISKVIEPPRPTKPPLIKPAPAFTVRLELVREEVAILDKVLLEPEMVLLVRVWLASKVTTVPEALGKVKTVLSVPEKVRLLLTVKVLAEPIVKVPVVVLMVNPLIEAAVATPILGVVKVGELAKTILPEPVVALPKTVTLPEVEGKVKTVPSVPAKVRELLTVKVLALAMVKVALVAGAVINSLLREVAVATPKEGVVKLGEVAKTILPVPVVALPKTVTVPPVAGKVKAVASVPEKVRELLTAKVLLAAMFRVLEPLAVMVKPL